MTNRPTEEQIAEWKAKHGSIFQIEVGENGDKIAIFRNPKMSDIERAMASDPTKKKPLNFNRSLVANCKLYADPGVLENDDSLRAIYSELDEIIETKEAHTKKL